MASTAPRGALGTPRRTLPCIELRGKSQFLSVDSAVVAPGAAASFSPPTSSSRSDQRSRLERNDRHTNGMIEQTPIPKVPLDLAVRVGCKLQYYTPAETPALLAVKPRQDIHQLIAEGAE